MSTVMVRINRSNPSQPWGFKMQGGQEFNKSLVVTSVSKGSIADKNGIEPGDAIINIGGDPTNYMNHQDAQQAIIRCGNELQMQVFRKNSLDNTQYSNSSYNTTPSYNVTPSYTQDSYYQQPSSPYGFNSSRNDPGNRFRSQTTIQVNSEDRGFRGGNINISNFNSPPASSYHPAHFSNDSPSSYGGPHSPQITPTHSQGAYSSYSPPKQHQPIQIHHQAPTQAMPWSPPAHTAPLSPRSFGGSNSPNNFGSPMSPKHFGPMHSAPMPAKSFGTACPIPFGSSPAPQFNKPLSKQQPPHQHQKPAYFQPPQHQAPHQAPYQPPRHVEPQSYQPKSTPMSAPQSYQPKSTPMSAPAMTPKGGSGKPRHFKPNEVRREGNTSGTAPVCGSCFTKIRGPFLAVLDKCYCPDHFICAKCNRTLEECSFVENGGQLFCSDDYARYLAPTCAKCSQKVIEEVVTAMEKKWHPQCFVCTHCSQQLGEGSFQLGDNNLPYCEEDWAQLFEIKCDKCGEAIGALDRAMEVGDKTLHDRCFCCSACQCSLDGKKFVTKNGKPFCKMHANAPALFL